MAALGLGVMIQALGGNESAFEAVEKAAGRVIKSAEIDEGGREDGVLILRFGDGSRLEIWDAGRSCCESRWMHTDDDLGEMAGARFLNWSGDAAEGLTSEWGDHEGMFLRIQTSKGVFVIETHNEHNGYYGGFWVLAEFFDADN